MTGPFDAVVTGTTIRTYDSRTMRRVPNPGTWEGRMALRAAQRAAEEAAVHDALAAMDDREQYGWDLWLELERAYLAGPPCRRSPSCWMWRQDWCTPRWMWWHAGTRNEGEWERVCDCPCHPEPERWELVAYA